MGQCVFYNGIYSDVLKELQCGVCLNKVV